jgi:hypothetical protein
MYGQLQLCQCNACEAKHGHATVEALQSSRGAAAEVEIAGSEA